MRSRIQRNAFLLLSLCSTSVDTFSFPCTCLSTTLQTPANDNIHNSRLLSSTALTRKASMSPSQNDKDNIIVTPDPVASMEALDALVPRHKITELLQSNKSKSNLPGVLQVAWHTSLFCLAAFAIPNYRINGLSLLAMAYVSSFFFHGLHETVHRTAFSSAKLNLFFAHLFGFLCVRPAQHYWHYHWQHHKYTGNPKLDSELQAGSFLDFPVDSIGTYLLYLSGIPFWIDAWSSLLRHAVMGKCPEMYLQGKPKACRQVIAEARLYLTLYTILGILACTYTSFRAALFRFWIWPAILGQPFLRFYLLAEHRGRKLSAIVYENTRTMASTTAFYRKLAWNMPYHTEHHAWPAVPFHQLPAVHQLLLNSSSSSSSSSTGGDRQALLDSGEVDPEMSRYNKGYIAFNWAFLRNLWRKQDHNTKS